MLHVSIPGEPVGAGRPRAAFIPALKRATVYPHAKSKAWQTSAAVLMRDTWAGRAPLDEPVRVIVQLVCSRPQSLLRRKDPDGRMWCAGRIDADNGAKVCLDALVDAGVLRDDKQVVTLHVEKLWARRDEGPSVALWLELIGAETANDGVPLQLVGRVG